MNETPDSADTDSATDQPTAAATSGADEATADAVEGPRGAAAVFGPTVNAIFAPGKAFEALDARPILAIWPVIWVTVALGALSFVNLEITKQFMRIGMIQGMAQQGREVDADQMRTMLEAMDTWAPVWGAALNLFLLLAIALIALLVWVGAGISGGNTRFMRSFGVASIAAVAHPLLATVFVTFMWQLNPPEVRRIEDIAAAAPTLGLGLVTAGMELSPILQQIVLRVDLFNVWWIVLVVMGAQSLLGLKRGAAIGVGFGIWLLTTLLAAFWASLGS